jgi:hypothetical protein
MLQQASMTVKKGQNVDPCHIAATGISSLMMFHLLLKKSLHSLKFSNFLELSYMLLRYAKH